MVGFNIYSHVPYDNRRNSFPHRHQCCFLSMPRCHQSQHPPGLHRSTLTKIAIVYQLLQLGCHSSWRIDCQKTLGFLAHPSLVAMHHSMYSASVHHPVWSYFYHSPSFPRTPMLWLILEIDRPTHRWLWAYTNSLAVLRRRSRGWLRQTTWTRLCHTATDPRSTKCHDRNY